jgi:hypothetical protein
VGRIRRRRRRRRRNVSEAIFVGIGDKPDDRRNSN